MDGHQPKPQPLEVMFLPFLAPGHMKPMVDTARLFAAHGVHATIIIATTHNALPYQKLIDHDVKSGRHIQFHTLNLTSSNLTEVVENLITSSIPSLQMVSDFFHAMSKLQPQIEQLFKRRRPHCIISDMFFPWTSDIAQELGIPRFVFYTCSYFALCCIHIVRNSYVPTDEQITFLIPQLPDQIEMLISQLPDHVRNRNGYSKLMDAISEAESSSYGVIVNSFYELEPAYIDHYTKIRGCKAWHIGPLYLSVDNHFSSDVDEEEASSTNYLISWLNCQKPCSVIYVSFGSLTHFNSAQLVEIALGLEASGHPFVWVVRKEEEGDDEDTMSTVSSWLPEGYEERMRMKEGVDDHERKGIILKGWAPQILILEHEAIGGFVSHCGWNSILESLSSGVPMITWPLSAEQFYNEKLITKVLRVGVEVGVEEWNQLIMIQADHNYIVTRERIERAVNKLMGNSDEEANEMRRRAKEVGEMAKKAVEVGGSSFVNLIALIEELKATRVFNFNSLNN